MALSLVISATAASLGLWWLIGTQLLPIPVVKRDVVEGVEEATVLVRSAVIIVVNR